MKLKTGDKVVVIAGANKGKEGKITHVLENRVVIEGVNIVKKHIIAIETTYSRSIIFI